MAEARTPGLPRHPTFRSQPALGRRLKEDGRFLVGATELVLERQLHAAVKVKLLMTHRALLRGAQAFLPVLAFPLLLALVWVSLLSLIFPRFLSREIFSWPLSVWVSACGAVLISVRRWARESHAASPMVLPPLYQQILSRGAGSAIFLASEKALFSFETLR